MGEDDVNKSGQTSETSTADGVRATNRPLWAVAGLPAVLAAAVVLVLASLYTGAGSEQALGDPGPLVRWGLPAAKLVHHVAMSTTLAALVFAAAILPRSTRPRRSGPGEKGTDGGNEHPAFASAMNLAAGSAMVWTLAAAAVMVLSFFDLAGVPVSTDPTTTNLLYSYIMTISTGQAWSWMVVIAAIAASILSAEKSSPSA